MLMKKKKPQRQLAFLVHKHKTPADKIECSCSEGGLSLIIAWLLPRDLYYQE